MSTKRPLLLLLLQIIGIAVSAHALNPSWRSTFKFWNNNRSNNNEHSVSTWMLRKNGRHSDEETNHPESHWPSQAEQVRGGSTNSTSTSTSSSTNKPNNKFNTNKVLQGSKSTIASTMQYWSDAIRHSTESLLRPIRNIITIPKSTTTTTTRREAELIRTLQTTPIERVVIVPNTTVIPAEVLQIAAKRAGLLGRPLSSQSVQEVARSLQQWYQRQGYILHSMTGATLQVETKTAELTVQEPVSSSIPVSIVFCKEMVIDPEDGSLLTFRQYRDKVYSNNYSNNNTTQQPRRLRHGTAIKLDRSMLNTTFIPTTTSFSKLNDGSSSAGSAGVGRTNPHRLATALGMRAGKPFCWHPERWNRIQSSGIFSKTIRTAPERMPDGTVQLQLAVQEAPARNLEYGITKSLYTDSWEGEIDFHHLNLLGGGESLGVLVRRGTHDAEPSIRVRFRDDKFGAVPGGYDVEVFSDFIGEHQSEEEQGVDDVEVNMGNVDYDHDELLDRKGISMSIRSPFSSLPVANSGSATLERTSTKGGRHESVGSATLNLGPVSSDLPMDARTSLFGKITTGTRIGESTSRGVDTGVSSLGLSPSSSLLLPFASVTATTRQIFPLSNLAAGPLVLALQHSATASTRHLPRHEANAHGVACKIRGYHQQKGGGGGHSERVSNSLVGTTELRIPLKLPQRLGNEASVVLFGDWSLASSSSTGAGVNQMLKRRSSVGLSLRKNVQGLPIKYDISLTQDRKIGAFFGLGPDFQA